MSDLKRLGSEEFMATLAEAEQRFGAGKKWPTDQHGRLRFCVRCESLRPEMERHDPDYVPPMAHTWISPETGRRVWSTRCRPCLKFEWDQQVAREREANRQAEVAAKAPQIGMRPKSRGNGIRWPWEPKED